MRGKLNAIILCTLQSGNKYGLEIIKEIKKLTYGQMDVKLPSLYSNLHKLETEGYITSYWENSEIGGKRRYSALTEKGKKYIQEHPYNFDEFKKYENVNKNVSSTLAIQPDFFNTIEHSQRTIEVVTPSPTSTESQEEIQNYSILDYINNTQSSSSQSSFSGSNQDAENSIFVRDKTDAVLLTDDQIIPQDASTSLLYRPTTLTHKDLIEDTDGPIDYDSIFGDMLEKDKDPPVDNNNFNLQNNDYHETDRGILLDPNEKGKFAASYQSMVSNRSKTEPIVNYNYSNTTFENNDNSYILYEDKPSNTPHNDTIKQENIINQNNEHKDVNAYLLKEKVDVEDNLKANIFLKKQNKQYNYSSDYDFYSKYDSKSTYEKLNSIISNSNIVKNENIEQEHTSPIEVRPLTLLEYIEDCENNGIIVQKYRKNQSKLKSHRVYINKTNLLTSILSFATLVILMFICYFAFKNSLSELQSITYLIICILCVGLIYPIVCAIIAGVKHLRLVGYYDMKKEWLPRLIIFAVIVLLTISINLLCGLNTANIVDYLPFIVLPIVASLTIFIDYLYKSLLLQLKAFREE